MAKKPSQKKVHKLQRSSGAPSVCCVMNYSDCLFSKRFGRGPGGQITLSSGIGLFQEARGAKREIRRESTSIACSWWKNEVCALLLIFNLSEGRSVKFVSESMAVPL